MKHYADMFSLKGERALVTGGATGLGLAVSRCLHDAGAEVVMVGTEQEEIRRPVCEAVGHGAYYRSFDVADTERTDSWVAEVERTIGPISILVNNAGVHCKKPVEQMSDSDFQSVLDVHIMGAFSLCRALIPRMKERGAGNILFTASMTSFIGQPYVIAYACAKSGYLGMMRTLASEVAPNGIRVNAIVPGWVDTPMLHQALQGDETRRNKIISRTPLGKFGQPEDVGWAAVYLASPAAAFVNGVALPVDGGALIGF